MIGPLNFAREENVASIQQVTCSSPVLPLHRRCCRVLELEPILRPAAKSRARFGRHPPGRISWTAGPVNGLDGNADYAALGTPPDAPRIHAPSGACNA